MQEILQKNQESFIKKLDLLSQEVWEKELFASQFLLDLFEGTLPRKKFARYLIQDYYYLVKFAQAMAMATARGEDLFALKVFAEHLRITVDLEMPRVWKMMTRFGVRKTTLEKIPPMPATIAYTDFLFNTCSNCTSAEVVGAIYPCNFSYRIIGKKIRPALRTHYNVPDSHISFSLYQKKIFRESAANTLEILSRGVSAGSREFETKILEKFYTATKFERQFWDQNY
jgi:thiaminase (transcriptional activator TenA)